VVRHLAASGNVEEGESEMSKETKRVEVDYPVSPDTFVKVLLPQSFLSEIKARQREASRAAGKNEKPTYRERVFLRGDDLRPDTSIPRKRI
jgi:hypothetical protein